MKNLFRFHPSSLWSVSGWVARPMGKLSQTHNGFVVRQSGNTKIFIESTASSLSNTDRKSWTQKANMDRHRRGTASSNAVYAHPRLKHPHYSHSALTGGTGKDLKNLVCACREQDIDWTRTPRGGNEDDDELSAYEVSADLKIFLLASIIITTKRREAATCLPFARTVGPGLNRLTGKPA